MKMTLKKLLKNQEFPKKLFDKNGNQIYCEKSNGYWIKKEYDSNNNRIYFKDSDGVIKDDRPKQIPEYTMDGLRDLLGYDFKIIK